jgi:HSP20 family molecular chaperone IbpA
MQDYSRIIPSFKNTEILTDWEESASERDAAETIEAEQQQIIANAHEAMTTMEQEEEQIASATLGMISPSMHISDIKDLVEALATEFKIRNFERSKIMKTLTQTLAVTCLKNADLKLKLGDTEHENALLKAQKDKRNQRLRGASSKPQIFETLDVYDWVVDISLITDLMKRGWEVEFSTRFWDSLGEDQREQLLSNSFNEAEVKNLSYSEITDHEPIESPKLHGGPGAWEGAVVAVVGLYDKGKTFVLNSISNSNLPSGKRVNTKGLSFKHTDMDSGTRLILLDTAGSYSPVKVVNEFSVAEKEATELFLLDLVFDISDYFICVVNDFTSLDQRFLDRIMRSLQNSSNKTFREVIVVHNLKEVESQDVLDYLWETQVTQIYGSGSIQRTKVAATNPKTQVLQEKEVVWFKTQYSRHISIANADSEMGQATNPWAFSLLKYWLKAVFVPVNRPISVVEAVMTFARIKLCNYFRTTLNLELIEGTSPLHKLIQCRDLSPGENFRLPHITMDSSGFIMTRPDSFLPHVDIIEENDIYSIVMDIPGLSASDITLSRQNVVTIVQGKRRKPYPDDAERYHVIKNERKYGEFAMSFKIPETYERRWSNFTVESGVLRIDYVKDDDDRKDTS